ncbi:MAG: transketolase [bacterium]|nr:transketolase [Acidimicrobiia bacterium]MCY4649473.1 transketolase [bacterium]
MRNEFLAVAVVKGLAMDAVQRANSGHPGMPMGMADIAVTLWSRFIKVDPDNPTWPNRDRFVLSNGHGSMLLYAMLHLCGFPITMEDLKNFRQWGYPTAGHPERELELGIETTTGPLGQGFANGVGMAVAEEHLRARLGADQVDHHTYGFVSDGDLMEGVAAEAASLAGHLGLGRLIYYYDDNRISIDGTTDITFSEDVDTRFRALGWHTVAVDGHDREAVAGATLQALDNQEQPSLIICRTHIGAGSPNKVDTPGAHGAPLGAEEVKLAKENIGIPAEEDFWAPSEVYRFMSEAMERGRAARREWESRDRTADWHTLHTRRPVRLDSPGFEPGASVATRNVSGKLFGQIGRKVPGLIGGAADLAESTKTVLPGDEGFSRSNRLGRNIHFGVREHGMGGIVNGMALHGGLRPYGSTFFVFTDYMRPSIRLSALMELPCIWVMTHDSIMLGEDGPTHQPVEHLASLRAMPGLWVIRPADATESVEAWEMALNRTEGPTVLVFSRQGLPVLDRSGTEGLAARGGYVVRSGDDVVIMATGSEVSVALGASDLLESHGVSARVVSLPCWEAFEQQDPDYRQEVLGRGIPRVSIEAGATFGWEKMVGSDGLAIGIDRFGASAPHQVLAQQFGFDPRTVAERVLSHLSD